MLSRKPRIAVLPYIDDGMQHLDKAYVQGIKSIGAEPIMLRYETPVNMVNELLDHVDGVLVSGGGDVDPEQYGMRKEEKTDGVHHALDELEMRLIPLCIARDIPVFGICRGIQIINVALGGTLVQDIPTRFGVSHRQKYEPENPAFMHEIHVLSGSMLYEITGGDISVNSYHHQCVDRLAKPLIASAYAPEGFVEAVQWKDNSVFLMGVQWHPELTLELDTFSGALFERFGTAVRQRMD